MRAWSLALVAALALTVLAGCISNDDSGGSTDEEEPWAPATFTLPETITGLEPVAQMEFVLEDGTDLGDMSVDGIWFDDNLLYTSGPTGMAIVDVSNISRPVTLGYLNGEVAGSRDVDVMEHPNGYRYAVLAGDPGIFLVNVTDPRVPVRVSEVAIGYHNMVVVPGTPYVYNSRSLSFGDVGYPELVLNGGIVDIIDFTDPLAPQVTAFRFPRYVQYGESPVPRVVTALGCHDISVNIESNRAYCAGVSETQVWDIHDPLAPNILQVVQHPGTNIHHGAWGIENDTILVIGDELGGAAFAPGCTVPNQPYGGVWFIDISDLSMPTPLGWWAPSANRPGDTLCTAHFGNFIESHDIMVMGFYHAGAIMVDYSDPTAPVEIAAYAPGGTVWEAQHHRGYVFTGDTQRGVDILRPTGSGEVVMPVDG